MDSGSKQTGECELKPEVLVDVHLNLVHIYSLQFLKQRNGVPETKSPHSHSQSSIVQNRPFKIHFRIENSLLWVDFCTHS